MIGYESNEKIYRYQREDLLHLLEAIKGFRRHTKEELFTILNAIEQFQSHISEEEIIAMREREETEEEAKEYFGEDFVEQFDSLLTRLNLEDSLLAIHGTSPSNCESIMNEGLLFTSPELLSTAVLQTMDLGEDENHYHSYSGLRNWAYFKSSGLVLISIPFECFYQEGLWRHIQDDQFTMNGVGSYCIPSEFILGYVDVEQKKIIINPNYHRQHDYSSLVRDYSIYQKLPIRDNEEFRKKEVSAVIGSSTQSEEIPSASLEKDEIDLNEFMNELYRLSTEIHSIKNGFPDGMSQEKYHFLLSFLAEKVSTIQQVIPLVPSEEELRREEEKHQADLEQMVQDGSDADWDEFSFQPEDMEEEFYRKVW